MVLFPDRQKLLEKPQDVLLAMVMWGEARDQGEEGMLAVGCVVMNRVKKPCWWGDSVPTVILKPDQFDCFNTGDPNLTKILALDPAHPDPQFAVCLDLAVKLLAGTVADPTGGATAYYAPKDCETPPSWAMPNAYLCQIGDQKFYRGG